MRSSHKTTKTALLAVAMITSATLVACSLNTSAGRSGGETHPAPPASRAAHSERITYGTNPDNYGILHLPEGPGPHPIVVMVHGGGWLEDHDLSYFEPLAQSLSEEGVAVWNIEYRRVGGDGGWPTTLADADDATESLASVVQQTVPGLLDLDRVHVAGHSAGGHLAAWIAGRHTLPAEAPGAQPAIRLRSATIMAGVFDLSMAATAGHDGFVRALLDGLPQDHPDRYLMASPVNHLPIGLPVTALHGTADQTVDPAQSRNYITAANSAGDNAELRMLDGVGHGDFGNVDSEAWAVAKQVILKQARTGGTK